ncbi:unnamed protein product, partial [Rotaria sp. Silwood1]
MTTDRNKTSVSWRMSASSTSSLANLDAFCDARKNQSEKMPARHHHNSRSRRGSTKAKISTTIYSRSPTNESPNYDDEEHDTDDA